MSTSTTTPTAVGGTAGTATPVLEATGLVKAFGTGDARVEVLHGIDLTVETGEFVAIMGPSGSGKSTLLYCLSGLDDVTDGSVRVAGREITTMRQPELADLRLRRMGFVFQQVHLLRSLDLVDNVVLPGATATPRERARVEERARGLLRRVGVEELADREVTEASGGQLQRVAIARALVNEPEIVFGDEPTGALNAASAAAIMDLLAEVNAEGRTVVLVTHDVQVAARTRRVVVLRDGHVDGDLRREPDESDGAWSARLAGWLTGRV